MRNRILFLLLSLTVFFGFGQNEEVTELVKKGIGLHDKGNYKEAIEVYEEALKIDPNSSLVNYEIAFSYFSDKNYAEAEKYSKIAIDLNDGNLLPSYITYANALDLQGESKKALKVYEKAIKQFDHYLLYYNYSYTCFNEGKYEKSYDIILKGIDNNVSHASSHLLLSKLMDEKGERIKAMLPLYFFLLIEPNSDRSVIEYENLRNYLDYGVIKSSEKNIDIRIPENDDASFGAAEMMISLTKASNSMEDNLDKSDLQLFSENNESIFKILGELKKDNTGFWWDLYVPLFYEIANKELIEPFSYYISLSRGEEALEWIDANDKKFEEFKQMLQ